MVTSRGNSFYPNLAVNFTQTDGTLSGGPYNYTSGGTALITQVVSGSVDSSGWVRLTFTVKEGNALRATFQFTGRAGSRNMISGDPTPDAGSGFEPCTDGCGYQATLEGGSTEVGFFTMLNNN